MSAKSGDNWRKAFPIKFHKERKIYRAKNRAVFSLRSARLAKKRNAQTREYADRYYKHYSKEESDFINKNAQILSARQIALILGRTIRGIKSFKLDNGASFDNSEKHKGV